MLSWILENYYNHLCMILKIHLSDSISNDLLWERKASFQELMKRQCRWIGWTLRKTWSWTTRLKENRQPKEHIVMEILDRHSEYEQHLENIELKKPERCWLGIPDRQPMLQEGWQAYTSNNMHRQKWTS